MQLESDSSQPIVIPRQETNQSNPNYLPESYHTARSFKQSPNEYQFGSSVNSTNSTTLNNPQNISSLTNNSITNNISNLRNPFNSSSPGANYSPRAEPPSNYYNVKRGSMSDSNNNNNNNVLFRNNLTHPSLSTTPSSRPSLLTSKLAGSSSSIHQLSSSSSQQQQSQSNPHDSPQYPYPNPKTASFRNSFLKSSTNQPNISSSLSSSINQELPSFSFPNRSSNINIEQPSTSQHFKHSEVVNSFTPFHNTPSVVSSSYSSAPNSVPNTFHPTSTTTSSFQSFPHPGTSIPTTNVSTESAQPNEFSRPSASTTTSHTRSSTSTEVPTKPPSEPNLEPDQEPPQYTTEPVFSSSLSESSPFTTSTNTSVPLNNENHLDIVNHPVNDLLLMLSALLQKIVEANDSLHPHHYHQASQLHQFNKFTANVLAFHGRNVPAISLHAYLTRILKYCPVTNEVFLTLLVYFDRIAKRANAGDFDTRNNDIENESNNNTTTTTNDGQQLFVMDSYNIHRLIIAGITVASKFFSDIFYKNSRYAKVGGLPLEELNHLELQFLLLTDFKLMIQIEELQRYADLLLKFWKREQTKDTDHEKPDVDIQ